MPTLAVYITPLLVTPTPVCTSEVKGLLIFKRLLARSRSLRTRSSVAPEALIYLVSGTEMGDWRTAMGLAATMLANMMTSATEVARCMIRFRNEGK
jgi:hypothetical protein